MFLQSNAKFGKAWEETCRYLGEPQPGMLLWWSHAMTILPMHEGEKALYSISSCKGSVEFAPLELQTIHYTFAHVPGLGDITSKQLQLAPSVAPSVEKQAGRANKACTTIGGLALVCSQI